MLRYALPSAQVLTELQAALGDGPLIANHAYGPPHDAMVPGSVAFSMIEGFSPSNKSINELRVNAATSFDCPFEGRIDEDAVYAALDQVLSFGHEVEIGLCDTTGRALPDHVAGLCEGAIRRFSGGVAKWAYHGHDTFGLGVANALYAYDAGVRVFDASVAGLGGCPFAPGATGNTASEDLVFTFENMGISTGVDLAKLLDVAEDVAALPDTDTGGHIRIVPRKRVLDAA